MNVGQSNIFVCSCGASSPMAPPPWGCILGKGKAPVSWTLHRPRKYLLRASLGLHHLPRTWKSPVASTERTECLPSSGQILDVVAAWLPDVGFKRIGANTQDDRHPIRNQPGCLAKAQRI